MNDNTPISSGEKLNTNNDEGADWVEAMADVKPLSPWEKTVHELRANSINLVGRNLGEQADARIIPLTERNADLPPEELAYIKAIEDYYKTNFEMACEEEIHPMELDAEGKVALPKGTVYHACGSHSIESIKSTAKAGVLASEWFGISESENEATHCAFLQELPDENNPNLFGILRATKKRMLMNDAVDLMYDTDSPLFQKMMRENYFQYVRDRTTQPEAVEEKYPKEIRDLYEGFIVPNSGNIARPLTNPKMNQSYWGAIPGGIPPQLVNGIHLNTKNHPELLEHIGDISTLYPHATIFDNERNVLNQQ